MSGDKRELFAALGMVGTIGFQMAAAAAIGLFGGRLLDKWFGTGPWLTVVGIVLGMVAGLWGIYKRVVSERSKS